MKLTLEIDNETSVYLRLLAENNKQSLVDYVGDLLLVNTKRCRADVDTELVKQFILTSLNNPRRKSAITLQYIKVGVNRHQRNTVVYALCALGLPVVEAVLNGDDLALKKSLLL